MIDTEEKLAEFAPRLRDAPWVALDTEADSLHAYPEKLCLMQISVDGIDRLIDPLAGLNLEPLLNELRQRELIMHGSDYDLRLLQRHCDFVPASIFDTMIASRLLGERQFGLNNLVAKYLGVNLEKGPQKANWARRPLTPRMELYARHDTHYLKPLADMLKAELIAKGRLEWHQESCARLVKDCTQPREIDRDQQWRVKGSSKLSPAALAVLREIWHWREQEALAANKPPYFILQPETMSGLASTAVNAGSLDGLLPRHLSHRRRRGIQEAIQKGLQTKDFPSVHKPRGRRQSEAERKRLREFERHRNQRANELGIDPSLVASRSTLIQLAQSWDQHVQNMMKWQRQLLES